MELRLDMHVHSRFSPDGRMELDELLTRVRARNLHGAAVCDHDCVLPEDVWRTAAEKFSGLILIPGTEISTDYGHLLGWFVTKPIETRDFEKAVMAIHDQDGLAVLAHPFEHTGNAEEDLLDRMEQLAPLLPLLDGVEVWNSRAERKNPNANQMAEELASLAELRGFGGSDAHVPREVGNGFTTIDAAANSPEAVKAALAAGSVSAAGVRSYALDCARSQWTRRRKTGAGALSYCKWALFAVKCLYEDLLAATDSR